MVLDRSIPRRAVWWLAPALAVLAQAGCGHLPPRRTREPASTRLPVARTSGKVTGRQAADVQVAFGRSLEDSGNLDGAEAAYRDALKHDPHRADAQARLAVLCDRKGDTKGSALHFAAATRLDPRNPEIPCDQGYGFYLRRRWGDAEASLRRAIELDPRHARSHNNLGLVLARKGDDDGALAEFGRAGCDPADARSNLGLILAMEGRFAEAKVAYAAALAARPDSPAAREGLDAATVALAGGRPDRPAGAVAIAHAAGEATRDDPAVRRASADLPALPGR